MLNFHTGELSLPGITIHQNINFEEFYNHFVKLATTVHVNTVENGIVQNVVMDFEQPIKINKRLSLQSVYASVAGTRFTFQVAPRQSRAVDKWLSKGVNPDDLVECANYGALTFRWGDIRYEDTLKIYVRWNVQQEEIQDVVCGKHA